MALRKTEKIDSLWTGRGQAARRLRFFFNRRDARVRAASTQLSRSARTKPRERASFSLFDLFWPRPFPVIAQHCTRLRCARLVCLIFDFAALRSAAHVADFLARLRFAS